MSSPATDETTTFQAKACIATVGVLDRADLRVLHVRGDDHESWLNGQITSDVRQLAIGASVYALAVNVRGKIMSDLWVTRLFSDRLTVLLSAHAYATVLASFEHFIIMEDVVLEAADEMHVLSLHGPRSPELVQAIDSPEVSHTWPADMLGTGGAFMLSAERSAVEVRARAEHAAMALDGGAVSDAGYELARLRRGVPAFPSDFDDTCYPQEAGLKEAISFQKGCYLGQEVVCTLENRGRLTRRLCVLEAPDRVQLALRTPLSTADGAAAGELRSHAYDPITNRTRALGYVKRAHALAHTRVTAADASFEVVALVGDQAG